MIKVNKQRYFDVSFWYSRASWGVLGCLGVSWGNKTDPLGWVYGVGKRVGVGVGVDWRTGWGVGQGLRCVRVFWGNR